MPCSAKGRQGAPALPYGTSTLAMLKLQSIHTTQQHSAGMAAQRTWAGLPGNPSSKGVAGMNGAPAAPQHAQAVVGLGTALCSGALQLYASARGGTWKLGCGTQLLGGAARPPVLNQGLQGERGWGRRTWQNERREGSKQAKRRLTLAAHSSTTATAKPVSRHSRAQAIHFHQAFGPYSRDAGSTP